MVNVAADSERAFSGAHFSVLAAAIILGAKPISSTSVEASAFPAATIAPHRTSQTWSSTASARERNESLKRGSCRYKYTEDANNFGPCRRMYETDRANFQSRSAESETTIAIHRCTEGRQES